MELHKDKELFKQYIEKTAKEMNTEDFYIEKDYYVVKMLKNIANSPMINNISFKGGTSLSKGWDMLQRFSEDVDIRVYEPENETFGGGVAKRLYKSVEAVIPDDSLTSRNHKNNGTSLREPVLGSKCS